MLADLQGFIGERLESCLGLKINRKKTRVVHPREQGAALNFLGYRVAHPQWRVWQASAATLQCDARTLYGPEFQECLSGRPRSRFLAEGSAVTVNQGSDLSPASAP